MTSIQPTHAGSFDVIEGKPEIIKQLFHTADAYNGGGCLFIAGKFQRGVQNALRMRFLDFFGFS